MKTTIKFLFIAILFLFFHSNILVGQSTTWDIGGNLIGPSGTDWLGTSNNQMLVLRQNNRQRAFFFNTNWPGHNNAAAQPNVNRMRFTLGGTYGMDPYSMMHLGETIGNATLARPWMNVGTTYTGGADILYVGLLQSPRPDDGFAVVDAVMAWGCNDDDDGVVGPDNFRFLFINPTNTTPPTDASESQGLEMMRITPIGNVGIGDFSHMPSGLDQQPTQRLDVDGTARLRQMPNEEFDVIITGVHAADPEVDGDYILNYSTIEDFTSSLDIECDWNVVNGGNDVATGYSGACVEGQVLVGTDTQTGTTAKVFMTKDYAGTTLLVEATNGSGIAQVAGSFIAEGPSGLFSTGVSATARNGGLNFGVTGNAQNGMLSSGVYGVANGAEVINFGTYGLAEGSNEPAPLNNVGAYGRARGYASTYNFGGYFLACDAERNIGVYGETCDHGGNAGYFVGSVVHLQSTISISDENVKTDFNEIESALGIINELNPKEYFYNTSEYPHLNLKNDKSYGFSAQEVQQVLPDVIKEVHHPAKYDTSGEMISPPEDLLGIQYQEFIAILTAGIKEQQAQIQSQDNQIAGLQETMMQMQEQMQMMQDQINGCCQGDITPKNSGMGQNNSPSEKSFGQNELYQNTPNPFRSQTTISYTLEQGGKVLLNIFDKTGKPIATLVEAEQPADTYRYEWDASGLPAGLYHYALYVDGELLVKKAIKLAD